MKRGSVTHVGVVSKKGGTVDQITNDTGLSGPASWSPDGHRITFGREISQGSVWTVQVQ